MTLGVEVMSSDVSARLDDPACRLNVLEDLLELVGTVDVRHVELAVREWPQGLGAVAAQSRQVVITRGVVEELIVGRLVRPRINGHYARTMEQMNLRAYPGVTANLQDGARFGVVVHVDQSADVVVVGVAGVGESPRLCQFFKALLFPAWRCYIETP